MTISNAIRGVDCGTGGEHDQPPGAPFSPHAQVIRAAQGETSQAIFPAWEEMTAEKGYESKQRLLTLLDATHIEMDTGNKGDD